MSLFPFSRLFPTCFSVTPLIVGPWRPETCREKTRKRKWRHSTKSRICW